MKQLSIFLASFLVLSLGHPIRAQVSDDFTDGDFSNNPTWSGTANAWSVVNQQLKSTTNSTVSPFYLSTPSTQSAGVWRAYFRYASLLPTSGNHSEFWIMADNNDLTQAQNGYFIRIGDTDKDICLYSQVGGVATKIIDGPNQMIAANSNSGYVQLTRTAGNQFALWAIKINTSSDSLLLGTATDENVAFSTHLGILVKSTASNFGKHFYDDFLAAGPAFPDQIAPSLQAALLLSPTEIELQFDEPLDENFAEIINHYGLTPASSIQNATLSSSFPKIVKLELGQPLSPGVPYTVSVLQSKDLVGNIRNETQSKTITYNPEAPYRSIVINEMMVNPLNNSTTTTPQVEWIELYNPGTTTITLNGWKIGDASGLPAKVIPLTTIPAGGYHILSATANSALFPGIPFTGMVIPALNNDMDSLVLSDSQGNPVDVVSYNDSWYRDPVKKAGGYSLEMIQPKLLCTIKGNWIGANAPSGGSPGTQNTAFSPNLDLEGPSLVSISFSGLTTLSLKFSEAIDPQFCSLISLYSLNPSFASVVAAEPNPNDSTQVTLTLSNALEVDSSYSLNVTAMKDQFCNLKMAQSTIFQYNTTKTKFLSSQLPILKLSPNPTKSILSIDYQHPEEGRLEWINSHGQKMGSQAFKTGNSISVDSLPAGIYQIRLFSIDGEIIGNGRFIKE